MNKEKTIISDLGNGLVLRRATTEDTDALAKFNGELHGEDSYQTSLDIMVREMMSGTHPQMSPKDFTIVEKVETGEIVSSLNLIEQTWAYEGIEFGVGRPELVGTKKEYRRNGLVRKQMELIHEWSKERGHLIQAITGIPWYYRMFGYEMTVNFMGGRRIFIQDVPELKKDENEIISIRITNDEDIPFIQKLYKESNERNLLYCKRSTEMWKHEISGRYPGGMGESTIRIIENSAGESIGYLIYSPGLWGNKLSISAYELIEGVSWLEISPAVLRYLKISALENLEKDNEKNKKKSEEEKKEFKPKTLHSLFFQFGIEHPFFTVFSNLLSELINPYAWYIRVEDIPAFLNLIKPALEKRLSESYLVGYTGELKMNFYMDGIILIFENGLITSITKWKNPEENKASVSFPDLVFLHILLGYNDIDDLTVSRADCFVSRKKPETKVLMRILFPKKTSNIFPIE